MEDSASDSPRTPARKLDSTKRSLFDLPAELRVQMLETYCEYLLEETWRTIRLVTSFGRLRGTVPIPFMDNTEWRWTHYLCLIRDAQLVCHQFRDEFMAVWARVSTFCLVSPPTVLYGGGHVAGPVHNIRSIAMKTPLWIPIRDLLNRLGPFGRHHVRNIRLIWQLPVFPRCSTLGCPPHVSALHHVEGKDLCIAMERLDDVHHDLKIQLELELNERWRTESFDKVSKRFTLKQRSSEAARAGASPDWICIREGPTIGTQYPRTLNGQFEPTTTYWILQLDQAGELKPSSQLKLHEI